jgi:hypothetical protein
MALQARGWRGSTVSRAREQCWVHSIVGSGRTTLLLAWGWCCELGVSSCVVNGVTSSGRGRWRHVKGLDRGLK